MPITLIATGALVVGLFVLLLVAGPAWGAPVFGFAAAAAVLAWFGIGRILDRAATRRRARGDDERDEGIDFTPRDRETLA